MTKTGFNFEVFRGRNLNNSIYPMATIGRQGTITFNKRFREDNYKVIKGLRMILHYDKTNQIIGFQVVAGPSPISYPIFDLERSKGMAVSARAFLRHNRISFEQTRSYRTELYKEINSLPFFIIDLKQITVTKAVTRQMDVGRKKADESLVSD